MCLRRECQTSRSGLNRDGKRLPVKQESLIVRLGIPRIYP
ncbi:hypothetical protein LptCag_1520 [Leptospirillum ferriphilum]|uniref:Uncharacterized protein n=1 Tax=Leptospirillum ferriphilum TaxID=178606 RepID=A0A094WBC9_9BACT|nr:hypothetical protein LptCag_1520 [Leptospirillum ferriphilum]